MAGFQLSINGRFWVSTEAKSGRRYQPVANSVPNTQPLSSSPSQGRTPNVFLHFCEKLAERRWGTPTSQNISSNRVNSP
jgi:hypothetical protein